MTARLYEILNLNGHVLPPNQPSYHASSQTSISCSLDSQVFCNNLHVLHRLLESMDLVNASIVLLPELLTS